MKHLTDEELSAYLDGAFKGRDAETFGRHLAACQPCREALEELAAQDESLKPALAHDPGDAYFERFAARVEERLAGAGAAGARTRGGGFGLGRFFRSPRGLALAGGVAVVVVGGGLALMTGREVIPPDLRDQGVVTRIERPAREEAKRELPAEAGPALPQGARPSVDDAEQTRARGDAAPSPTTPTPADARLAVPGRAREVRWTESGEEAPVRKEGEARIAPLPAPAPVSGADRALPVRKKLMAEPLEATKRMATEQRVGAAGAAPESAAQAYSFAPAPGDVAGAPGGKRPAPSLGAKADVRLCGEVRDEADRPIAGAQVVLADLGRTTTTDASGRFCLSVPPGEHPLSVMAVGYTGSRQSVRSDDAPSDVRVTLAAVPVLEERTLTLSGRAAPGRFQEAPGRASAAPPPEPRDAYSALSDTLRRMVRDAQRLEADAAARRSAARYDLAAGAWERVLRRLVGGSLEIETRRHLAEARYRAWETGPNSRRAQAAVEALTGYATRAPAGPERDQAARWLDQVRP